MQLYARFKEEIKVNEVMSPQQTRLVPLQKEEQPGLSAGKGPVRMRGAWASAAEERGRGDSRPARAVTLDCQRQDGEKRRVHGLRPPSLWRV